MYEALNLHVLRDPGPYLLDFRQRKFPCRNHPAGAKLVPEQVSTIVCIVGLGADVDFHVRKDAPCDHENAGIGNDERIRPDLRKLPKIRLHAGKVAVVGQDIGRDVHLDAAGVCKSDALFDLLVCKILRLGPEPEGLSAKINGVSPVDDRRL